MRLKSFVWYNSDYYDELYISLKSNMQPEQGCEDLKYDRVSSFLFKLWQLMFE